MDDLSISLGEDGSRRRVENFRSDAGGCAVDLNLMLFSVESVQDLDGPLFSMVRVTRLCEKPGSGFDWAMFSSQEP